jgi:predicted nucleotide-binding protein
MAAKRSGSFPPEPESKIFSSVREIEIGVTKLQRRLAEVVALEDRRVKFSAPEVDLAESNIGSTVLEIFGPNSPEYRDLQYYKIWKGAKYVDMHDSYCQNCFVDGIADAKVMLGGLITRLEEKMLDLAADRPRAEANLVQSKRIFIGHGRSAEWLRLAQFISERLGLAYEEFNREPAAGFSTKERLEQMLESSGFAFLIMTADDEHADGSRHARENVIHEVGLFQGRHGFRRAILLIEEGCAEFSNISGLAQIRFPAGDVLAKSEEVRRVLEREGVLKS